jgi:hypothetical protein
MCQWQVHAPICLAIKFRLLRTLALVRTPIHLGSQTSSGSSSSGSHRVTCLADASIRGRIATGQRAGRGVQRLGDRIDPEDMEDGAARATCVAGGGFSLHAGVVVPSGDRERLEHLCRYVARPPVATGRLSRLPDGRLLYRLKRR